MENIRYDIVDHVGWVTLDQPEKLNALTWGAWAEIESVVAEANDDDNVKCLVFTGEGRGFSSGTDLTNRTTEADWHPRPYTGRALKYRTRYRATATIYHCIKPTIAAVNGVAVGGGFGLCTAFDVRVASEQARFGTIFIKRALAPDCGLSWFLPRLVGPEAAADLFYTGRIVDAQEALRLGIVSRVVPHEALMDEAMKLANEYARQAPSALTLTRRALQRSAVLTLEQQLEFEWTNQRTRLASPEFQEALSAFREKREPNFS